MLIQSCACLKVIIYFWIFRRVNNLELFALRNSTLVDNKPVVLSLSCFLVYLYNISMIRYFSIYCMYFVSFQLSFLEEICFSVYCVTCSKVNKIQSYFQWYIFSPILLSFCINAERKLITQRSYARVTSDVLEMLIVFPFFFYYC